jgi:hypothetical protein
LFVFSPKLTPDLFALMKVDVWRLMREIKQPVRPIVTVAKVTAADFLAATRFSEYRVNRVITFRDALLEAGVADDKLWNAIVAKFTSFVHVDRPPWLID